MSFNKKILALAIAGALPGAAFAVVDLNLGTGVPNFASEVTVPVGGLALSNVPLELNVQVAAGFGVSTGQTRFIRFDYTGAKLNNPVTGADFGVTGVGTGVFTVVDGGDLVKEYVIVQVTAGVGIIPGDLFTFRPSILPVTPPATSGAVKVFNKNTQLIKYALYEFGGNAVSQSSPLSGPLTGTWFTWGSGIAAACTAPTTNINKIDASNPKLFVGGLTTSNLFNLSLQTTGALLPSTGVGSLLLSDFMGPTSSIKTTGSYTGPLTLTPPSVGGSSPFVVDGSLTFGTWANLISTFGSTPIVANTTPVPGTNPMVASSYSVLITPAPGALATLSPIDLGVCGRLEFSGSSDRVDFGLTPNATTKQFLRITNPSKDGGAVNVSVWNDAGLKVDFPLSAVKVGNAPGVNLPGILSAFSSTPLIDVNAFDTAAKTINPGFSVGTGIDGKPGKIRIEVRGDFGNNELDGNLTGSLTTPSAGPFPLNSSFSATGNASTSRLKDGIYIQAINNGSYNQTH